MGKTFDQSLIDVARIPMSLIDPDDMKDLNSEEFLGLRRVQQGCHSELSNREDFPFNKSFKTIKTRPLRAEYPRVEGTIYKVIIDGTHLKFTKNLEDLSESTGKPTHFGFRYNPEQIVLYPTPDKEYTVNISYNNTKNIINPDGTTGYIITNGSTLRMPEWVQPYYFDALEYFVLATNMRKLSNPRWQPTLDIFNQRWRVFLNHSQGAEAETYFTI